jgi:hypothetical protein
MTEEQILNAIANACEDDTLRFQIIIYDKILHVYINRPTQAELNYQDLKSKIYGILTKTFPSEFSEIWLYCRVLGEVEADWQAVLEIEINLNSTQISAMMQAINGAVEATNLIVDKIEQELENPESFASYPLWDFEELPTTASDDDSSNNSDSKSDNNSESHLELLELIDHVALKLDLNQYCFISNQRLLYAVLNAPQENIARLVDTFDRFEQSIKRSQLPALEIFFSESINPDLDTLESEVQSWWTKIILLDSEQQYQLAIWLSRYCLHPEQTISTISKVFIPQVVKKQKRKQKQVRQTNDLIEQKLAQQIFEQNQNSSTAQSGLFSRGLILLRQFLEKIKPTK